MWSLGPIGFASPWLLLGLGALPVLWLILRAVPPAPVRRRFPGVALLLGLSDDESQTDRTPWWLLLLRMAAVALAIIGFSGPVLNPQEGTTGDGPLLILADGTWADARDWPARTARIEAILAEAQRDGRPTALVVLTDPPATGPDFQAADVTRTRLPALTPRPWEPEAEALAAFAQTFSGGFDTYWLSDGLARDSRADLLQALQDRGDVRLFQSPRQTLALRPVTAEDGLLELTAIRTPTGGAVTTQVIAIGLDPAGVERPLASAELDFAPGDSVATAALDLPPELRNRLTRFELEGLRSAAAVTLADDTLRRREVALIADGSGAEGPELLDPLHYLREALSPSADLIEGDLSDLVPANPDVAILADVARLSLGDADALRDWVEAGGLLVRFAGPRLAASDLARNSEDPLLPVRLRAGGRSVGGAMSWGEPKSLAPFTEDTPFYGLALPGDVAINAQVMAQPDPTLADRVIAQLSDGTPLVTRKPLGDGQVVLFHVTANAEWSSLPLSGLFVQMLDRLAISSRGATEGDAALEGTIWTPEELLDARGALTRVDTLPGVPGERIAEGVPGPDLPPGLYAGEDRRLAINVIAPETTLAPAAWPEGLQIEGLAVAPERPLAGWLLAGAMLLLALDILASLALGGRLRGPRAATVAGAAVATLTLLGLSTAPAEAQDPTGGGADAFAIATTSEVVLAHVLTGDPAVDEAARAGLLGLSQTLFRRTSIEPGPPVGIDIETDDIALLPFLYWPITGDGALPSSAAVDRINRFLRSGGMILFDTRDAHLGGFGSQTPEGRRLQAIARPLAIPPIEPIPSDHILTRTFYLLQDFPGRHASRDVWVEASPDAPDATDGMPFRTLNDGVTPVVIGGNDWAAAWAVTDGGNRMFPVGRGTAGERQREIALRFGVNLIMHVLTGNYKSDQVHVPALLERLGQ